MRFFNLDLHVAVIKDLMDFFVPLGHHIDHWSISAHSWVHGWKTADVDVVNQHTWQHLNKHMCDRFLKRYGDMLSDYDAFIVTHTPSFSLLYAALGKPVIVVASTRYEAPFTSSPRHWKWLNDHICDASEKGLMVRVANNKYDQRYCELFTGLPWMHIPSYCGSIGSQWAPVERTFLVDAKIPHLHLKGSNIVFKKSLGRFSWNELVKFSGIIVFPYNVSVMSVFEYYAAGIPLFFPTRKFCIQLYEEFSGSGILSEISWLQIYGANGGSALPPVKADPNNYHCLEVLEDWIEYSDWYDSEWMPHITFFDSFPQLEELLRSADLADISGKMQLQNIFRKKRIEALWEQQLANISMNKQIKMQDK